MPTLSLLYPDNLLITSGKSPEDLEAELAAYSQANYLNYAAYRSVKPPSFVT